jgi:hypothetical protein
MNINNVFPSNYLKAADLNGRAVLVTIDKVTIEKLGEDTKPVIYFAGKQKGVVLNKTNASVVAASYGPETDGWIGRQLEVYPDRTQFQGSLVDCLRVRVPVPAASPDEEAPF